MSKINNLTEFLTDVAGAIRTKKNYPSTQKINPQNFASEIESISTASSLIISGGNFELSATDTVSIAPSSISEIVFVQVDSEHLEGSRVQIYLDDTMEYGVIAARIYYMNNTDLAVVCSLLSSGGYVEVRSFVNIKTAHITCPDSSEDILVNITRVKAE